ncbi:cation efflux system protein [Ameyamaea chiangmaiensis NBRC 103196]|uniref:Cation transporter n=1 Tax=Ameyamaea chiangmaiensis TaxID=442969 RepID=A0A850PDT4_9PROT|nr:cation diffusion facilitator family transporter [Ameyamaea chiangmaiensis]MBS4074062.1 cation transporter [Ameyamaea chiangmaiensis]NVN40436.1 cation transporter [Ameyamaea chiangmaiensis]GBQ67391.1 cation efflux system protein [Ameyamaea chiangmaiensis NBRC 103196]
MHDAHHSHDGHDHAHHHGHDHGHGHAHGGHVHALPSSSTAFAIGIALNTAYLAAETLWGLWGHSLALLADAGHNLSDVLALAAAWGAQTLGRRAPSARFTYGLRKSSILVALGNAIVLMLLTGGIVLESIDHLLHPVATGGTVVMIVAALGIVVNGGTALLFAAGAKEDLNVAGAFAHMMSDAVMSLVVVAAGGLIWATGWTWLDPAASIVVSVAIVVATWSLLRRSLDLALDGVPKGVDPAAVADSLRALPGVADLHDLHIWPLSTTETALTAHLVRTGAGDDDAVLAAASGMLAQRFRIGHATLQVESVACAAACALSPPDAV